MKIHIQSCNFSRGEYSYGPGTFFIRIILLRDLTVFLLIINFYVPEWFTTLTRRSELATIKQEEVADVFAFVGKSHVKSEM